MSPTSRDSVANEFEAVAWAYAAGDARATTRVVARACARASATATATTKPSASALALIASTCAKRVRTKEGEGAFEVVVALCAIPGGGAACARSGVMEAALETFSEGGSRRALGFEAARAMARAMEHGEEVDEIERALIDVYERAKEALGENEAAADEEAAQAALLLARARDGSRSVDVGEEWCARARQVLEARAISKRTLVGPAWKYMSKAQLEETARSELKRIARGTSTARALADGGRSGGFLPGARDEDHLADEKTPLSEETLVIVRESSVDRAVEALNKERRERAFEADAPFATRRHFVCDLKLPLPADLNLDDLFFYEIDAVCAYSEEFERTLALTLKWVKKCAATLRRSVTGKTTLASNRGVEFALRARLFHQVTALNRLTKLAKITGARNLLLANEDEAFISAYNIERWISRAFSLIRDAAKRDQSLTSYAVMALICHDPEAQRFSKSEHIPLHLAFIRWSRLMYAHRAKAKKGLLALVKYESALVRKSFYALREFLPYHRERLATLALKAGLRWKANASVMASRRSIRATSEDGLDNAFQVDASFKDSPEESIHRTTSSRRDKLARMSSIDAPSIGRVRSRKARSIYSKTSLSVGELEDLAAAAALENSLSPEQLILYEAFHSWVELTFAQLSLGANGLAMDHRDETLIRKAFTAMRRYVARSVAFRKKCITIEKASIKLDLYITGNHAFKRWLAGVRYIKRLHAFVDSEVERWTMEFRVNCFQAWREVGASRSEASVHHRARVLLYSWSAVARTMAEERVVSTQRKKALLRRWRASARASVVARVVANALGNALE